MGSAEDEDSIGSNREEVKFLQRKEWQLPQSLNQCHETATTEVMTWKLILESCQTTSSEKIPPTSSMGDIYHVPHAKGLECLSLTICTTQNKAFNNRLLAIEIEVPEQNTGMHNLQTIGQTFL